MLFIIIITKEDFFYFENIFISLLLFLEQKHATMSDKHNFILLHLFIHAQLNKSKINAPTNILKTNLLEVNLEDFLLGCIVRNFWKVVKVLCIRLCFRDI